MLNIAKIWHPSSAKALAWLQHISHVCWTHKGVELLLKSSQVLDTKFLTIVYLQTSPVDRPLTIWRSAKLQMLKSMEGPMSRSLKASVMFHDPLKTEPCSPLGAKGSNFPSCSQILGCLTCWQGVSFFPLRIFSSAVTNWQKIKTLSWLWKWKIRKGISSALEVLSSHTTGPLRKKTCPRNMVTSF